MRDGETTFAWQVKDNTLHKVKVNLGARDARSGEFALIGGVNAGDAVLRYPTSALKDGQRAETGAAANPATVVAKDGATGTVEK